MKRMGMRRAGIGRIPATLLAAPALLLLAACGGGQSRPPATAESPVVTACRQEARNSVDVRALARQQNTYNPTQTDRLVQLAAEAEGRAFNDCLRRNGLVRGGGVEAVRPPSFIN